MGNLWFTDDNKRQFAIFLLMTPSDPIAAAMKTFPDDPGQAMRVIKDYGWETDEYVQDCMDELRGDVAKASILPSKEEYAAKLWQFVTDDRSRWTVDDRLKGYKLFGEVMSFIERPQVAVQQNVAVDNRRVMIVKDSGNDDDWERKLEAQQMKLIDASAD